MSLQTHERVMHHLLCDCSVERYRGSEAEEPLAMLSIQQVDIDDN